MLHLPPRSPRAGAEVGCGERGEVKLPVIVGVLLAVVVLAAGAVRLADAVGLGKDRPRVAVIGDSITELGQKPLYDNLSADYRLSVDGKGGFKVAQQMPTAERFATRSFDQVVIELGTNDVMQGADLDRSASQLRQIVALFPDARCIHLVNINESMESRSLDAPARARQLNAAIAQMASADPRVDVIDFAGLVRHYESVDPGKPMTRDGVHPTDDGFEEMTAAYETALDSCPKRES